jgi:hypothetical protein
MRSEHSIETSLRVRAEAATVWREITRVDLASFRPPIHLALLGIPRPVRAEIARPGAGGARTAFLSNGRRFSQEITEWQPPTRYAFTFRPDPGFRVGYFFDLADGPLRMIDGSYLVVPADEGVWLRLSSRYELHGVAGWWGRAPVRMLLRSLQTHLLNGIRANAEHRGSGPAEERAGA